MDDKIVFSRTAEVTAQLDFLKQSGGLDETEALCWSLQIAAAAAKAEAEGKLKVMCAVTGRSIFKEAHAFALSDTWKKVNQKLTGERIDLPLTTEARNAFDTLKRHTGLKEDEYVLKLAVQQTYAVVKEMKAYRGSGYISFFSYRGGEKLSRFENPFNRKTLRMKFNEAQQSIKKKIGALLRFKQSLNVQKP